MEGEIEQQTSGKKNQKNLKYLSLDKKRKEKNLKFQSLKNQSDKLIFSFSNSCFNSSSDLVTKI